MSPAQAALILFGNNRASMPGPPVFNSAFCQPSHIRRTLWHGNHHQSLGTSVSRGRSPFRLRRKQIPETSRSGTTTTRRTRSGFSFALPFSTMGEGLGGHQEEPTTIAQVCAAYADIWHRAIEDYTKEFLRAIEELRWTQGRTRGELYGGQGWR